MWTYNISYNGSSKILRRIIDRLNHLPILGTAHTEAGYGDESRAAFDHSKVVQGNPHRVTLDDLGIGRLPAQFHALMEALGTRTPWTVRDGSVLEDHEGEPIYFQTFGRFLEYH